MAEKYHLYSDCSKNNRADKIKWVGSNCDVNFWIQSRKQNKASVIFIKFVIKIGFKAQVQFQTI